MLPTASSFERIALNRATFGARDLDVDAVKRSGWSAWVDEQLAAPPGDDPQLAQYLASLKMHIEYPAYSNAPYYSWPGVNEDRPLSFLKASPAELWEKTQKFPFGDYFELERPFHELCTATFIRNVHSRYQLREVMTDFWLNHFNIWGGKNYHGRIMLVSYERDSIRPFVFGHFRRLLEAVAISPSMLKYLDNADSEAVQPNENYARELMELHTLGRAAYFGKNSSGADVSADGFTDADVIAAARALSGWTIKQGQYNVQNQANTGEFVFNPQQHNTQAGACLGFDLSTLSGIEQGRKVLDLVAHHPTTARFICAKICKRLFGENPPAATVNRAVETWMAHRNSHDQIARVLRAILLDGPEIGQGPATKVRRPHERLIAFVRGLEGVVTPYQHFNALLSAASDAPFGWVTPDGKPDTNDFWLNPAVDVENWNHLQYILGNSYITHDIMGQTPEAARRSGTLFVEHWVGRLVGHELPQASMTALISRANSIMTAYANNPPYIAAYLGYEVVAMIASTPEFVTR
jgi:hypothetical protein